jgi:hypothetical protein
MTVRAGIAFVANTPRPAPTSVNYQFVLVFTYVKLGVGANRVQPLGVSLIMPRSAQRWSGMTEGWGAYPILRIREYGEMAW